MKYARRIPYIGTLLGGATFAGILTDENTSKEEKIKEGTALVAGTLGAAGGAALGAMIAGWAGAPTGPGALLTAAVGGIAGAVSTEALARMLMEELIGGGSTQAPNPVTTLTQNANGGGGATGGGQGPVFTLPPTSGARVTSATSESSALAGVPNYIIMDNSQKSVSTGNGGGGMFNFGGSAFYDQFDPLAGTRTAG